MRHFLAPVPAVHIEASAATFRARGSVLLGSNQFELLTSLKGADASVWLAASTGYVPAGGVPSVNIGKVLYCSRFVAADMGDARGRPNRPDLRPATTEGDTAWTMYYEITDLLAIDPPIATASLHRRGGGRIEVAPHMLVEIDPPRLP